MKRAVVKQVALAVLLREGFNTETAERLADLIAHERIPAEPKPAEASPLDRLEKAIDRVKEPH
jgi:hypothetical protein